MSRRFMEWKLVRRLRRAGRRYGPFSDNYNKAMIDLALFLLEEKERV